MGEGYESLFNYTKNLSVYANFSHSDNGVYIYSSLLPMLVYNPERHPNANAML